LFILERRMAEVFYPTFYKQYVESQDSVDSIFRPPHFFGEIAKTQAGVDILAKTGHVKEFLSVYNNETANPLERRSIIWALVKK
jgi:hypothetical protein